MTNTAQAVFEYYEWQERENDDDDDDDDDDDRYYYHAFLGDIIACYIDVFVTDGEITDQTMHLEYTEGTRRSDGATIRDFIGNEFVLPKEVRADVLKRIKLNHKETNNVHSIQ